MNFLWFKKLEISPSVDFCLSDETLGIYIYIYPKLPLGIPATRFTIVAPRIVAKTNRWFLRGFSQPLGWDFFSKFKPPNDSWDEPTSRSNRLTLRHGSISKVELLPVMLKLVFNPHEVLRYIYYKQCSTGVGKCPNNWGLVSHHQNKYLLAMNSIPCLLGWCF